MHKFDASSVVGTGVKDRDMANLLSLGRRLVVGCGIALGAAAASAATYNISLFEGATGTGSGQFTFNNPGTAGSFLTPIPSLATNASSTIGAQTFTPANLNVVVAAVDFVDGKTPPNTIKGNFVEGLTGTLVTPSAPGGIGCSGNQVCYAKITFSFIANANPNLASKTYSLEVWRIKNNGEELDRPAVNGTYAVANTSTIPEPGSLALSALALLALAWRFRARLAPRPH